MGNVHVLAPRHAQMPDATYRACPHCGQNTGYFELGASGWFTTRVIQHDAKGNAPDEEHQVAAFIGD